MDAKRSKNKANKVGKSNNNKKSIFLLGEITEKRKKLLYHTITNQFS